LVKAPPRVEAAAPALALARAGAALGTVLIITTGEPRRARLAGLARPAGLSSLEGGEFRGCEAGFERPREPSEVIAENGDGMQRALVTGASRGIGRALVAELAGRGLEVIATARRADDLAGLSAVARLALDVTSDASVAAAAEAAGRVDVLVNNAGVSVGAPVEDTPASVALAMFDTNVVGPLRLIKAFLPGMRQRSSGTVVNVSSVGGQVAFPLNGANGATKHALEALSETLAMEVRRFGIRVLVVQLGGVATGMYEKQERYFSPAYADLNRSQQDAYQDHQARRADLTAEQAACRIADAVADVGGPLRVPIGQDAAQIIAARARLDDAAWATRVSGFARPESKESR
jgi:NAD(P)-dependent dehydrogenase (short-subunit alcohol dehydrogenase family)